MVHPKRKTINRERLLDRGVVLLMEQGYHGTGLKEILDAVGIPKGSFYNYFESKEAFGAEVIAHYIEPFIEQLEAHLAAPGIRASEALGRYFGELIRELDARDFRGGCLLGNLMGEIGETSELCRQALAKAVSRYRDSLAQGIVRAQDEGDFRRDIPARAMADFLLNAWQGALLRMKIDQSAKPLRECCRMMLDDCFKA